MGLKLGYGTLRWAAWPTSQTMPEVLNVSTSLLTCGLDMPLPNTVQMLCSASLSCKITFTAEITQLMSPPS